MGPENKEKTYGEQVVGANFNPSKDSKVDRLKELAAEMIDIVGDDNMRGDEQLHRSLRAGAIHEILTAQMHAVKAVTYSLAKD